MTSGISGLIYLNQPKPEYELELDNSYYLIKITDAQAFFPASSLSQVNSLLFSSSVECSFIPGPPVQSLYSFTTLRKNIATRLGVSTNLTDWLPARSTDKVRITMKYTVTRGAPVQTLIDKINKLDLVTKVTPFLPGAAVALKVTEIVGNLLSSFLQEGESTDVLPELTLDLNLGDLKSGFYTVISAAPGETLPRTPEVQENGPLRVPGGRTLDRHSYVVIQVLAIKRRGLEVLRDTTWGELLQICKDRAINTQYETKAEQRKILQEWRSNLGIIRILAGKDRSILQKEIDEAIASAHLVVEQKLQEQISNEADGQSTYSPAWQEVLGFSNVHEVNQAAQDYQDAVAVSEQMIQSYEMVGN